MNRIIHVNILKSYRIIPVIILFWLISSSVALTRQQSVLDFIDSTRKSVSGYSDTPSGDINLLATVQAMEIKRILNDPINNSLDILYYFQRLQNSSGGFAMNESSDPSLEATIIAVNGLQFLELNQSQYVNWQIYPYFNQTIQPLLLEKNNSSSTIKELTEERLQLWIDYIEISFRLGIIPSLPVLQLVDAIKNLQYANGSYISINMAIESINLLSLLGEIPVDADLASKFIQSFIVTNGAFGLDNKIAKLETTFRALYALDKITNLFLLETRSDIIRFVFNQQNARSGFSEVGEEGSTVSATRHAILILLLLNELDELIAPDVLQEVGFINYPWLGLLMLPLIRRIRNE